MIKLDTLTPNFRQNALISINALIDIDIGLFTLIKEQYLDPSIFNVDYFKESNILDYINTTYYRKVDNPLYLISNINDKNLLDELGYQKLDLNSKKRILNIISNYSFEEIDRDYRDLYFTGLERVLLRHNHFEMVGFQRIAASDHDGIAKDAYLYELRGDYSMAMKYYNMIGESERYDICLQKSAQC